MKRHKKLAISFNLRPHMSPQLGRPIFRIITVRPVPLDLQIRGLQFHQLQIRASFVQKIVHADQSVEKPADQTVFLYFVGFVDFVYAGENVGVLVLVFGAEEFPVGWRVGQGEGYYWEGGEVAKGDEGVAFSDVPVGEEDFGVYFFEDVRPK